MVSAMLSLAAGIGLAMLTVLALRSPLSVNVLHDRNPLYVELRDGSLRNGYDVKILNMTPAPREFTGKHMLLLAVGL